MKRENLLVSRLRKYSESDFYPFHMPGHKRQVEHTFLAGFPNPYTIDITEIEGFDNLHHPEGILKASMEWAAEVYGTAKTYYLVNGSSSGILSAICATTHGGGNILMARNCHKSVYHGVILNYLTPDYIYPQNIKKMGIQGGILPKDVEKSLQEHKEIETVLVVSPTYDGIVSDIRAISEVVHRYNIPLIVDEAHGAHFPFGNGVFPESAVHCGADIVIQSLHKTLPSFTQTAVLHVQGSRIDLKRLEQYLQMFQSSSPSYVFLAGMESCIDEMERNGTGYMQEFAARLSVLRRGLRELKHLQLLDEQVKGTCGVFDLDQSKLVISCGGYLTGEELGACLRERYQIEMELCGADYVVALTSFLDSQEGMWRLQKALLEIDGELDEKTVSVGSSWKKTMPLPGCQQREVPDICMTPAQVMEKKTMRKKISDCAGSVSAEFIYLYPPGIPIVVPGELITEEMVERVLYDKETGLSVQGMADKKAEYLLVVDGR